MAKNVFILGAGASAEFGAPVMSNFLDVAEHLYATGNVKDRDREESFENVFDAISKLQAVHSKSELDLVNIESVFTAFELAKTLGRFPGRDVNQIEQLINDLKWVIVSTLQKTLKFPLHGGRLNAPHDADTFIKLLKRASSKSGCYDSAILTFNYDMIFDVALLRAGLAVDYGLLKEPSNSGWMPLLKLHGSLNWTTNSTTGDVVPWFLRQCPLITDWVHHAPDSFLPIGDYLKNYTSGTAETIQVDGKPVIVPPSWNKADSHRAISKVWARAAEELSTASSIFVIGYSLPETDSFFRQLYALGTVGDTLLKRFWVFNPDKSRENVFKSMLGPGARERYKFFPKKFSDSLDEISNALNQ